MSPPSVDAKIIKRLSSLRESLEKYNNWCVSARKSIIDIFVDLGFSDSFCILVMLRYQELSESLLIIITKLYEITRNDAHIAQRLLRALSSRRLYLLIV